MKLCVFGVVKPEGKLQTGGLPSGALARWYGPPQAALAPAQVSCWWEEGGARYMYLYQGLFFKLYKNSDIWIHIRYIVAYMPMIKSLLYSI